MLAEFKFPIADAARLLDALSNGSRLLVIGRLLEREWDVSSLADEVGLSQSALSQHLRKLRFAGVVSTRREAQTIYYSCRSNAARALMNTIAVLYPTEIGNSGSLKGTDTGNS